MEKENRAILINAETGDIELFTCVTHTDILSKMHLKDRIDKRLFNGKYISDYEFLKNLAELNEHIGLPVDYEKLRVP